MTVRVASGEAIGPAVLRLVRRGGLQRRRVHDLGHRRLQPGRLPGLLRRHVRLVAGPRSRSGRLLFYVWAGVAGVADRPADRPSRAAPDPDRRRRCCWAPARPRSGWPPSPGTSTPASCCWGAATPACTPSRWGRSSRAGSSRQRARAMGAATFGASIGGMILAPLNALLLERWGGLAGGLTLAVIAISLVVPLAIWVVKDGPEAVGQQIDGEAGTRVEGRVRPSPTRPSPVIGRGDRRARVAGRRGGADGRVLGHRRLLPPDDDGPGRLPGPPGADPPADVRVRGRRDGRERHDDHGHRRPGGVRGGRGPLGAAPDRGGDVRAPGGRARALGAGSGAVGRAAMPNLARRPGCSPPARSSSA